MENAGRGVVDVLEQVYSDLGRERVGILCGKGNNGGDGFVVARHLLMRGLRPRVVLLADPTSLQGDAHINYELLLKWGLQPSVARNELEWAAARIELLASTVLVDAVLGTGLDRPVEGFLAEVFSDLTNVLAHAKFVAVDIPSGLSSDSGSELGPSLRADHTVTFTAPKPSQIFPPNCERIGTLHVVPIGTPSSLFENDSGNFLNLLGPRDVTSFFDARHTDSHKGSFGHVLIAGGSRGKSGAAAMAGLSALRGGAGLVTVATTRSAQADVTATSPALMTEPLAETESGCIDLSASISGQFSKVVSGKSVLAIGPGIGTDAEAVEFVRRAVRDTAPMPVVIDADGLNAFAGVSELLDGRSRTMVLTPHPGEMARLTGLSASAVQLRRVDVAREFARKHHVCLVLKGARTLIAEPDGQVFVNPTGNPGMSTAGSGDVLTGLIAALLAQHPTAPAERVVCAAVYWHGLAGDEAVKASGELSLIATDLIASLASAAAILRSGSN
jgi:NAD(P)H-hydrate epimerase